MMARASLREVAEIMDRVLNEMVQAERLIHGPACGGGKEIRKVLSFYRNRVLSRLESRAASPSKEMP